MNKETKKHRPIIFEYDDFRSWLADLYRFYKLTTVNFSYRYFSKRAGFSSPNYLKLVIDGQRNLSEDSLPKFIFALKMSQPEGNYFSLLVRFGQAKDIEERAAHASKLLRSRSRQKIHPLSAAKLRYYAQWYYIPIRELVGSTCFKENPTWISKQFRFAVSEEEVSQALRDLEKLELIMRNEEGQFVQTHRNVITESQVSNALVAKYHKDMIRRASHSIEMIDRKEREISGTCIAISQKSVAKIKNLVRDFRKDILALSQEEDTADLIYQLNFQLFPLAGFFKESEAEDQT